MINILTKNIRTYAYTLIKPLNLGDIMHRVNRKIRILSLDGGGIKGVLSLYILEELKRQLMNIGATKPLSHYFDLLVGCSTGALVVLGLVAPSAMDQRPLTVEQLTDLYQGKATSIFDTSLRPSLFTFFLNLFTPPKTPVAFEEKLAMLFNDDTLKSIKKHVLVPCLNMRHYDPMFFTQLRPLEQTKPNFYLRDLSRAATSDPLLFPTKIIYTVDRQLPYCLVDGGFFALSPTLFAYTHSLKIFPDVNSRLLLSVGTGQVPYENRCEDVAKWSYSKWVSPLNESPLTKCFFQGQIKSSNDAMRLIPNVDFYRFEPPIDPTESGSLNSSKKNLENLNTVGMAYIESHQNSLKKIAKELVANAI